ncbi:MAG: hypothetical protein DCF27_01670 [Lysobacteraceae bacterium]|nr:MAG: hypothetical protein DCF27_01670 [Xanthomonadaceae bacterium]
MSSWYYVDGGQNRQGPVSAEALLEAYRQGKVTSDSLVWREGLAEWSPLESFRGELGLASVAPAEPPSAPTPAGIPDHAPAKKNNGCLVAAAVVAGGGLFLLIVLGILAAIALPAYQDYTTRSKLVSVMVQGQAAKVAVEEFRANTDRCPRDAAEVGLTVPSTPGLDGLEVGTLTDGRCVVTLTVGMLGTEDSARGGQLLFTREDNGTWSCSGDGIPGNLLPSHCR